MRIKRDGDKTPSNNRSINFKQMINVETDPDDGRSFRTYIPATVLNEYLLALGKFFHSFARIEKLLAGTLAGFLHEAVHPSDHYRKTWSAEQMREFWSKPEWILERQVEASISLQRQAALRAVLGSMRLSAIKGAFVQLFSVLKTNDDDVQEFQRIMAQLSDIQYMRDRLAHNGADADLGNKENWFCTSDRHSKALEKDSSVIYFKAEHLEYMTRDLNAIPELLFSLFNASLAKEVDESPLLQDEEMKAYLADIRGPFQYKPNELKYTGPKYERSRN